jgi:hypothetical protein
MDSLLLLDKNTVQSILELNSELKKMKNFDLMFKKITEFVHTKYGIQQYLVTINENLIY